MVVLYVEPSRPSPDNLPTIVREVMAHPNHVLLANIPRLVHVPSILEGVHIVVCDGLVAVRYVVFGKLAEAGRSLARW
jgi:hypothetical protein